MRCIKMEVGNVYTSFDFISICSCELVYQFRPNGFCDCFITDISNRGRGTFCKMGGLIPGGGGGG